MADEVIELIDADPRVFDSSSGPRRARIPAPRPVPRMRRRMIAVAVAAATALATWAILDAKPWAGEGPVLRLDDSHPTASQLTSQLILDLPTDQVQATTVHQQALPASRDLTAGGTVGYFFGDARATFNAADGSDRWFGWYATPVGSGAQPDLGTTTGTVAGAPASVRDSDGGIGIVQGVWGPVDGYMFTGAASNVTKNEFLAIADELRVQHGKAVVLHRVALGTLHPISRFADYFEIVNMIQRTRQNGLHLEGVVGVYYRKGASIVSMPANRSALDTVPFALSTAGDKPEVTTVRGQRALGFLPAGTRSAIESPTVIWWESGRLLIVSGGFDLKSTITLANSAHQATTSEWTAVSAVN